jgi:hypothetical protein
MDMDELATPGYATLAPATRIKLSTLDKGQLMVRHPHFAQPVFVRFPRPAVLSGREGVEKFPAEPEPSLEVSVTRTLRKLDPSITLEWVKQAIVAASEDEVLRARNRTLQARPEDAKAYFKAQFRGRAKTESVPGRPVSLPLAGASGDDPYGF